MFKWLKCLFYYEILGWYDRFDYNRKKHKYGVWNPSEIILDVVVFAVVIAIIGGIFYVSISS